MTAKALEEAEAEGVVAGEPVHGFLLEQQDAVELRLGEGREQRAAAAGELGGGEVQGHAAVVRDGRVERKAAILQLVIPAGRSEEPGPLSERARVRPMQPRQRAEPKRSRLSASLRPG